MTTLTDRTHNPSSSLMIIMMIVMIIMMIIVMMMMIIMMVTLNAILHTHNSDDNHDHCDDDHDDHDNHFDEGGDSWCEHDMRLYQELSRSSWVVEKQRSSGWVTNYYMRRVKSKS